MCTRRLVVLLQLLLSRLQLVGIPFVLLLHPLKPFFILLFGFSNREIGNGVVLRARSSAICDFRP